MAALLAPAAVAQTPSLTILDRPPGRLNTFVSGISADGRVLAGYSNAEGPIQASYTWSAAGGYNEFGFGVGIPALNQARGISGNGAVVVGVATISLQNADAYRYADGVYTTLPTLAGYSGATGDGANEDGSIVVGSIVTQSGVAHAMRWTQAGGMVDVGVARPGDNSAWFTGMSRDGATAIGVSKGFPRDAYTWTQSGGWQLLPAPAGMTGEYNARPSMTNDDGSVVVGYVDGVGGQRDRAVLWRDHQPIDLGTFGTRWHMAANSGSHDGSVIVGGALNLDTSVAHATIWIDGGGPTLLEQYLANSGITVPTGWTLETCMAISTDGRTIAGHAAYREPGIINRAPFIVTIPAPGVVSLGVVAMAFARRRRRRV